MIPVYALAVLLLKSTLFFAAGLLALRLAARARSSAALRHMICLCSLSLPLLLPLAWLVPSKGEPFRIAVGSTGAARAVAVAARDFHGVAWLTAIWGMGVALVLLRMLAGYWRVRQIRRNASPAASSAPVPVMFADVAVPMVSGLVRPCILIPQAAAEWPAEQVQAALDHERAHIRRHDLHTGLLAVAATAIYWFHPLVWLLAGRLREAQEDACDDLVLEAGFAPADYAGALLATARGLTNSSTTLYGCAMTTQTNLKTRIARLLDSGIARTTSTATLRRTAIGFAALLVAVSMLGSARADEVYKAGPDVTAPSVVLQVKIPYPAGPKADHVQGTVVLQLVVGADGFARDFTVQSSPDERLSESAIASVQQWHFAPGMRKGEAVAVMATIEVNFRLNDKP